MPSELRRDRFPDGKESVPDYEALVGDDRVSSIVYRSPSIYRDEIARIWGRTWIYAGHASEIPEPGDYLARDVGLQPTVLIRGLDGEVRVFLNRCPHRGNLICNQERGSSKILRCVYHSWTFDPAGKRIGAPFPEAYSEHAEERDLGLCAVPRVDSYRGFIFVNFDPQAVDLVEHLGAAADYIDRFADLAPDGELDLSAGTVKVEVPSNWKLAMENNIDGYHPAFLHRSIIEVGDYLQRAVRQGDEAPIVVRDIGNGHSMIDYSGQNRELGYVGQTANQPALSPEARDEYVNGLAKRHGRRRAEDLAADGTWPVNIFPNLMITWQDVRTVAPVAVNASVVSHTPALLCGAPTEVNLFRLRQQVESYGPAGCVGADDVEMYERSQVAFAATTDEAIRLGRGIDYERTDSSGVVTGGPTDETAVRAFWRHYRDVMRSQAP